MREKPPGFGCHAAIHTTPVGAFPEPPPDPLPSHSGLGLPSPNPLMTPSRPAPFALWELPSPNLLLPP
eukprot:712355-Prorocentrum_minimum.AAC.1